MAVIIVLLVLIVSVLGYLFVPRYWTTLKQERQSSPDEVLDPKLSLGQGPEELYTDFDPTATAPMFQVVLVDTKTGELTLQGIWPAAMEKKEFESRVTCKPWDLLVVESSPANKYYLTARGLTETISEALGKKNVMLTGLCLDINCTTIAKSCTLYLYDK